MIEKLETVTSKTMLRLKIVNYNQTGFNYPRWESARYIAKNANTEYNRKHHPKYVAATQLFSGLRQEWVEENVECLT